jgi:hypothetical protein
MSAWQDVYYFECTILGILQEDWCEIVDSSSDAKMNLVLRKYIVQLNKFDNVAPLNTRFLDIFLKNEVPHLFKSLKDLKHDNISEVDLRSSQFLPNVQKLRQCQEESPMFQSYILSLLRASST